MKNATGAKEVKKGTLSPWLVILIVAPIPLFILGLMTLRWWQNQADQTQVTAEILERQNSVLAYDSLEISRKVSGYFEQALVDLELLSMIPLTPNHLKKFYLARQSPIFHSGGASKTLSKQNVPQYSHLSVWNDDEREQYYLEYGRLTRRELTLEQCQEDPMCDADLVSKAMTLPVGSSYIGQLKRWYSNKDEAEIEKDAHWPVAYRFRGGVLVLGIDYRVIKNVLYAPTFPYQTRTDLLLSYQAGDYVYLVNSENSIVVHPKYWHSAGIDPQSKKPMPYLENDEQLGMRPLNLHTYKGTKLRDYFERLLTISFVNRGVDIFRAPNVGGTFRVLSVVPIEVEGAQFREQKGVLGHLITGCAVGYFEEPKEKFLPYY